MSEFDARVDEIMNDRSEVEEVLSTLEQLLEENEKLKREAKLNNRFNLSLHQTIQEFSNTHADEFIGFWDRQEEIEKEMEGRK